MSIAYWAVECVRIGSSCRGFGLAHHQVLDVDEPAASTGAEQAAVSPASALTRPVYDWKRPTKSLELG